jgi:hypothetical protein
MGRQAANSLTAGTAARPFAAKTGEDVLRRDMCSMAIRFNNDLSAADFSHSCVLRPCFYTIPLAFKAIRKAA